MRKLLWILVVAISIPLITAIGCAKEAPKEQQGEKTEQKTEQKSEQKAEQKKQAAEGEMVFVSSTEKPEACASCHESLNEVVKKVQDHPDVKANTVSECAGCHKKEGYPPLRKIAHQRHYREGSAFVTNFKGSCVHCHKKTEGGEIFVAGLAPAGTKFMTLEVAQVDKAPNGCSDCHKDESSLPNMVKKIEGHPAVNFEDFNQCFSCHGTKAPQLGKVLHNRHLQNDAFKKNFGNSCQNCHKAAEEGNIVVKGRKVS